MSGATSRRKGVQYERDLVQMFHKAMPGATVRRGLQCRGGDEVPDVDCPVFWVEAKRGRKPNVRTALQQAQTTAAKGRIPLAVIRDDKSEAFVALSLSDFLEVVREWWEGRQR